MYSIVSGHTLIYNGMLIVLNENEMVFDAALESCISSGGILTEICDFHLYTLLGDIVLGIPMIYIEHMESLNAVW